MLPLRIGRIAMHGGEHAFGRLESVPHLIADTPKRKMH